MLLIWDYFGVLAQDGFWYTAQHIADGHHQGEAMRSLAHEVDLGHTSWEEYCRRVSEDIGIPLSEVSARYQQHDIKQLVIDFIHQLEPGHTNVVLSNASHTYLLPIIKRLGLNLLFKEVFVSSELGIAKPDPRAFQHVLDAMGYTSDEAIMIDDSPTNIETAQQMGIHGVLFTSAEQALEGLSLILKTGQRE
jgi:putative hydrolase of the HAD superfamily